MNRTLAAHSPELTPARRRWRRFLRHRLAIASLIVILVLAILSLAAPWIERALGFDGADFVLANKLQPPSWRHWLGTDDLGRDVMIRLLYGGRISLMVGLIAALAAAIIGTFIGIVAGYYGGKLDGLLMRLTDAVIVLPVLPLLIVLAAVDLRKLGLPEEIAGSSDSSLYRIVAIIALVSWTGVARLVRGATLAVKQRDFVRAAIALGASNRRVMWVHILPNVLSPVVVATTLSVGGIILFESVLSFLGLGIQPPTASWGNMMNNAQELITQAPHMIVFPGALIFIVVVAFNFVGDGMQDALDPRALSD
ncbi:MAG: ABC transporter permease [Alphaproteobacteria bacterium]